MFFHSCKIYLIYYLMHKVPTMVRKYTQTEKLSNVLQQLTPPLNPNSTNPIQVEDLFISLPHLHVIIIHTARRMKNMPDVCNNYQSCQNYIPVKQFSFRSCGTGTAGWQRLGLVQQVTVGHHQASAGSQQALCQVYRSIHARKCQRYQQK